MRRFLVVLFFVHSSLFSADLVRCPDPNAPLQKRLEWAMNSSTNKTYWTGYSITRLAYRNEYFVSGTSLSGSIDFHGKPTLQEWIDGVKAVVHENLAEAAQSELNRIEDKREQKAWKRIAVLERFQKGSRMPDSISVIDMDLSHKFSGQLYWLGGASHEESFQNLSTLYTNAGFEQKEKIIAAIGIHPTSLSFPFLKQILLSKQPEEVQEAAAVYVGEIDTPEALGLLRDVSSTNPSKRVRESAIVGVSEMKSPEALNVLSTIALSDADQNLRETAIAMLSEKKDPLALRTLEKIAWFDPSSSMRETAVVMMGESDSALPALLKIMEEHPSAQTREIAVHALAESVAGREALKNKLKND